MSQIRTCTGANPDRNRGLQICNRRNEREHRHLRLGLSADKPGDINLNLKPSKKRSEFIGSFQIQIIIVGLSSKVASKSPDDPAEWRLDVHRLSPGNTKAPCLLSPELLQSLRMGSIQSPLCQLSGGTQETLLFAW
ncbi:hypothetical protein C8N47_13515 [Mangrovibacterium marinum]|uniref:Uncharacterized protein n=1 Tax=Mangrovibacterium marinum TaxID=1639118 RepID=A0A2T5BV77_9BACT|nr:hypothetical protein C8N47_13515 [Mangrovibacterium marinum]